MANLSTPIGELKARYDVVVVGSGYGGSIVARRLAEAARQRQVEGRDSFSVCLLERGLEIRPGHYPSSLTGALRQVQADTRLGHFGRRSSLFDLRMNRDVTVLVGCGLGGTSLINASVMLEPMDFSNPRWPEDLRGRWPEELRKPQALAHEFQLVKTTLQAQPLPEEIDLDKVTRLVQSAKRDAKGQHLHRPPIAVSFHTHINRFGVQQGGCTLCGNCITGCNYSAKNSLIMNYLPAAAAAGAEIFCGIQVSAVEPSDADAAGDWIVHARLFDRASRLFASPEIPIHAGMVFLASGSLGSTEILLRSRDRYKLSLSTALGHHFSGNGDVIAFGYNVEKKVDGMAYGSHLPRKTAVGPTIAGMLDERDSDIPTMIQEGAVPGILRLPLRFAGPIIARLGDAPTAKRMFSLKSLWREVDSLLRGARHGSLARTQTFLAMGFDDGRGVMKLVRNRLRIVWNNAAGQKVFRKIAERLEDLTRVMRGRFVINPVWLGVFGRRLLIAHPLGGCALAERPEEGVVNPAGQVFRYSRHDEQVDSTSAAAATYRGLYVCDGAIIPTPLGTNPSLTISALAERIAKGAAETVVPANKGAGNLNAPQTQTKRIDPTTVGFRYAERLSGQMCLNGQMTRVTFFLHMSTDNIEDLLSNPAHKVRVVGVADAPDLETGSRQFTVSEGTFNVAIDDDRSVDTKLLVYLLKLTPAGSGRGEPVERGAFWLLGHKTINFETCKRSAWKAATQLPFVIFEPGPPATLQEPASFAGRDMVDRWNLSSDPMRFLQDADVRNAGIVGVGRVAASVADVLRLAASMEVVHERRFLSRLLYTLRFQGQFVDALVQARVWALRRTDRTDPFNRDVTGVPMVHKVIPDERGKGRDRFQFVHFDGKGGKPVILIPGFSMSTYWFRARRPKPNIATVLLDHGYDVWLLDYRASDRLDASHEQFTLDDLADCDFPAAIRQVVATTGQPVRVIAHCVGSLSVLMSLLSGKLAGCGVHSMILSQSFAFIDMPPVNRLKAQLHLAEILRFIGFRPVLTADFDARSSLAARFLDRLLYFYPSRERCRSGVCRRLLLIYGEANRHAQLDRETHEMIYDMVDRGNLTTIAQLQKMAVRRHIVGAQGQNAYLKPENGKHVNIPITLLQGDRNNLFRRSGAHKTLAWLHKHGGFGSAEQNRERFELVELPGYGHMDVFIGKDAPREVYPKILTALEKMESRESADC